MGHPCLYHTSEQQCTANRAKSSRHYQRYDLYAFNFSMVTHIDPRGYDRHLADWCERVTQLSLKFDTLVNTHPAKYVEALLSAYHVSSHNKGILHDAVLTLSRYQKSIQWYEDKILQLAGVGSEWREVDQLYNRVHKVVHWTEEILCLATVDPGGLVVLHAAKQLMFQVVKTSS
ncbi:hypothetical protein L208DRAFT_1250949 [Tricholoma matsutake]|nr:hypothetical protein L208DRAFT_1250949 [Tricholoma matsutake 945]